MPFSVTAKPRQETNRQTALPEFLYPASSAIGVISIGTVDFAAESRLHFLLSVPSAPCLRKRLALNLQRQNTRYTHTSPFARLDHSRTRWTIRPLTYLLVTRLDRSRKDFTVRPNGHYFQIELIEISLATKEGVYARMRQPYSGRNTMLYIHRQVIRAPPT